MHLSASGGVGNCGPACVFPIGGAVRFEFGYRFGLLTLGAGTSIGGAPYEREFAGPPGSMAGATPSTSDPATMTASQRGTMVMASADAFAMLNPLQRGRLDPFFAVGFGYHRFSDRATDGTPVKAWIHAPAFRL